MKKKTETVLAIEHSKRVCDPQPEFVDRMEVRRLVINAYKKGYDGARKVFNQRAISAVELLQNTDYEDQHLEVLSKVKDLLFHNQL